MSGFFFRIAATVTAMAWALGAVAAPQEGPDAPSMAATEMLPQVEQIMHPQRPQRDFLLQDVYVGLFALDVPADMDYMAIGADVMLNNYDYLEQALAAGGGPTRDQYDVPENHYQDGEPLKLNIQVDGKDFVFACRWLDVDDCVEQTLARKGDVAALIERNKTLLQRYVAIQRLPNYGGYFYRVIDRLPSYHYALRLSELRLAQALVALDAGDADTAFALLQAEADFARRMLVQEKTLIGKMVAINEVYTVYHTLSVLLDSPQMRPYLHDERLQVLIAPLSVDEQKAMVEGFAGERNFMMYTLWLYNVGVEEELAQGPQGVVNWLVVQASYDPEASENLIFLTMQPMLDRAALSMDEVADLYARDELPAPGQARRAVFDAQMALQNERRQNGELVPSNWLVEQGIGDTLDAFDVYLNRFYDVHSYLMLVHTKYQLVSAGVRAAQADAFMRDTALRAYHPITREPFVWDAQAQTLGTAWIAQQLPTGARGSNQNPEPMPRNAVHLRLADR